MRVGRLGRAALLVVLLAAMASVVPVAALASAGPQLGDLEADAAVVDATGTPVLPVLAVVNPGVSGQTITGVHAHLSADHPRATPTYSNTAGGDLTSGGGPAWQADVPVPRNATPGAWTLKVTATESDATTASESITVSVVLLIHLTLKATPSPVHAGGAVTLSGQLTRVQPAASPTADGAYVPFAGRTVWVESGGDRSEVNVTTNAHGHFTMRTHVQAHDTSWAAGSDSTPHFTAVSPVHVSVAVVPNATRIIHFNASPEPAYRNGVVKIRGTVQRNDPDRATWLPLANRTVRVYRAGTSAYTVAAVTHRDGSFTATARGSRGARAGTWHAVMPSSSYNRSSASGGDHVATRTPPLRITKVVYNPAGADAPVTNQRLNRERVTITNTGAHTANLWDWQVKNADARGLSIPINIYVRPGHSVTVHSGNGTDTQTQVYVGSGQYLWGNAHGEVLLRSDRFELVDTCTWTHPGAGHTAC